MDLPLILLAQTELVWFKDVLQLAQGAGFAGLVWYYHAVQMPRKDAEHKKEREEWMAYIKDRDTKYETLLEKAISSKGSIIDEFSYHTRQAIPNCRHL